MLDLFLRKWLLLLLLSALELILLQLSSGLHQGLHYHGIRLLGSY